MRLQEWDQNILINDVKVQFKNPLRYALILLKLKREELVLKLLTCKRCIFGNSIYISLKYIVEFGYFSHFLYPQLFGI